MATYLVDEAGDVCGRQQDDGAIEDVDPDSWGWLAPSPRNRPDRRRTITQLRTLPGFEVVEGPGPRFEPGPNPRRRGSAWMNWLAGEAPPAVVESRGGVDGTRAYFNRLSDAVGHVAFQAPAGAERSPFFVHDLQAGMRFDVAFTPIPIGPGGEGVVYILDDGLAFKVGHTRRQPASRIDDLQTGNPRQIEWIATIQAASEEIEAHLHTELQPWRGHGEWFNRDAVLQAVTRSGGWQNFLLAHLPPGDWVIQVQTA